MKKLLVVLAVAVLLLAGCGGSSPAADTEAVFKDWRAAAASLDLERMMSHYADEVSFRDPGEAIALDGRESVTKMYEEVMGLPGIKLGIQDYIISSDGRWAVGEGTLSWIPYPGGATSSSSGLVILEFQDGKIVSEIHYLRPVPVQASR
jgi:ketosteroid isomerase-like protein